MSESTRSKAEALGDLALAVGERLEPVWSSPEQALQAVIERAARSMEAAYVLVGFYAGDDRVMSCGLWANGVLVDNVEYDLAGAPCERVFDLSVCYHHDDVQAKYPEDKTLVEMGVHSYFGMPIRDHRGVAVGIVAVLNPTPLSLSWDSLMTLSEAAATALRLHSPAVTAA